MSPKTIKEIITPLKNKYGLSGLHSKPTGYMEYEDKTEEVINDISLALNSLLDEIDSVKPRISNFENVSEYWSGFNYCLRTFNNILSSLRSNK